MYAWTKDQCSSLRISKTFRCFPQVAFPHSKRTHQEEWWSCVLTARWLQNFLTCKPNRICARSIIPQNRFDVNNQREPSIAGHRLPGVQNQAAALHDVTGDVKRTRSRSWSSARVTAPQGSQGFAFAAARTHMAAPNCGGTHGVRPDEESGRFRGFPIRPSVQVEDPGSEHRLRDPGIDPRLHCIASDDNLMQSSPTKISRHLEVLHCRDSSLCRLLVYLFVLFGSEWNTRLLLTVPLRFLRKNFLKIKLPWSKYKMLISFSSTGIVSMVRTFVSESWLCVCEPSHCKSLVANKKLTQFHGFFWQNQEKIRFRKVCIEVEVNSRFASLQTPRVGFAAKGGRGGSIPRSPSCLGLQGT